jgi:hypothetical protein
MNKGEREMKKAMYYSLKRSWLNFEVVAVTSVKNNRWYGRDQHENPTNGTLSGFAGDLLIGKFETRDAALALVAEVERVREKHVPAIEAARDVLRDAERAQYKEIEALIKAAKTV